MRVIPFSTLLYMVGAFSDLDVFSQRVSESSQFLRFSLPVLIYGAIQVLIPMANSAVQGRIHIQGLTHLELLHLQYGITEAIW